MKIIKLIAVVCLATALSGCASMKATRTVSRDARTVEMLDWDGREFGADAPTWAGSVNNRNRLQKALGISKDRIVFGADERGTNLDAVELWADNVSATEKLARAIQNDFTRVFTGNASEENKAKYEQKANAVYQAVTQVRLVGVEEEASTWVKFKDGKSQVYSYAVAFSMKKTTYESLLRNSLRNTLTEEEFATWFNDNAEDN